MVWLHKLHADDSLPAQVSTQTAVTCASLSCQPSICIFGFLRCNLAAISMYWLWSESGLQIARYMGGLESEMNENTVNVIKERAQQFFEGATEGGQQSLTAKRLVEFCHEVYYSFALFACNLNGNLLLQCCLVNINLILGRLVCSAMTMRWRCFLRFLMKITIYHWSLTSSW